MAPSPIHRRTWIGSAVAMLGGARAGAAKPRPDPEALRRRIQTLLDEAVERHELPGVVALAAGTGYRPIVVTSGWGRIETRVPIRADTLFDIRSITKPVTALAALVLVDRGQLHLDASIVDSLPEARASAWARNVTLRHLLTHTSGLGMQRPAGFENLTETRHAPLADVARRILQMPLPFETGGRWRYSSPGYCLIGRLIEVVARKSFSDFATEAVLRPLEMRDTCFLPPREARGRLAGLYRWKDGRLAVWPRILPEEGWAYESPDFGLYSTAADLAQLLEEVSSESFPLFRRDLRELMLTPGAATDSVGLSQGLGWMVARAGDPPSHLGMQAGCFGHNGAGGSMAWADPNTGTRAVFLTQCFSSPSAAGPAFLRLAFQA